MVSADSQEQGLAGGRDPVLTCTAKAMLTRGGILASTALFLAWTPAIAQSADSATGRAAPAQEAAALPSEEGGIEDIVVTAQRRSQSLQDVPIAITALTGEALEAQGISSTDSLQIATPGLVMSRQGTASAPYLRGVGSDSTFTPGFESPIATYIDGVYVTSTGAVMNFSNVERVEVLRGPQGTLFGRNATGGAINIVTRTPSAETSVEGSLSYGNYDTVEAKFYGTTGSDKIAADVAVFMLHQGEGFGFNPVRNQEINRFRTYGIRSKLRLEASDADTITLSGEYTKDKTDLNMWFTFFPGTVGIDGLGQLNPDGDFDSRADADVYNKTSIAGGSLTYEHDFGWGSLTSITAYREVKVPYGWDIDATPLPIVNVAAVAENDSFQQELLLNGKTGRLDWTAGLFYYDSADRFDPLSIIGIFDRFASQGNNSYSAYAQGTYALTERTNVTGGIRYTIDKRDFDKELFVYQTPILISQDAKKDTFKEPTWRIAVDHQFSSDVLAYASYNRGFKSGAFDSNSDLGRSVESEKLDAYEIGLKSDLLDRQLRFNLAAFYYDYTNLQVLTARADGTSDTLNAGSARIKGAEVEAVLAPRLPSGELLITAGLSLLDGEYRDFANAPRLDPVRDPVTGQPLGGNITSPFNAAGFDMVRAPKWTSTLSGSYTIPVSVGELSLNGSWYHSDGFFWSVDGRVREPAYDIVNAQAALQFGRDQQFRVWIFGRNLTDTRYRSQVFSIALGEIVSYAPPRTYGIGAGLKF